MTKNYEYLPRFLIPACPYESTRNQLNRFSRNLISWGFTKFCQSNNVQSHTTITDTSHEVLRAFLNEGRAEHCWKVSWTNILPVPNVITLIICMMSSHISRATGLIVIRVNIDRSRPSALLVSRYLLESIKNSVAWVRRRELYRPRDHRLSAKLVPTLADRGCRVVSPTNPPESLILVF
jgi:hypothetical protein